MRGEEHWNWPAGTTVNVTCYTNSPEVRLTLSDKEIGTNHLTEAVNGALTWQVSFEPGTLKAIGLKDGKPTCEFTLKTAGVAKGIALLPDVTQIKADGKDICHVEFRVIDDKGVIVPDAAHELTFEIDGPAAILGIENGDLNSFEDYKDLVHKAYRGRGLAILQSTTVAGQITLKATSPGLEPTSLVLPSR